MMTRFARLAAALFCYLFISGTPAPAQTPGANRPNVILIYADDMAYGDMSANGAGAWVRTPNLDALAQSGIRFTNGYSAAPVCGPSRMALLAGAYPARFGTWWNPDTGKTRIPATQTLLPAMMRDNGYTSAIIGKWNLPTDPKASADVVKDPMIWGGGYWPEEDGGYTGVGSGWGAEDRPSGLWGPEDTGDEYLTDRLTRHATEFIAAQDGAKPFFIYLAYNAPHSPLEAHERYRQQVAHLDSEPKRLYAAMVLAVDDGVGTVRKTLAAKGLDQNTIIVFASDNGPAASDFRGYRAEWPAELLGAIGPLSGGKRAFREGGIRVPFVISWPAVVVPNQVRDDPVMTIDLYRTFADITRAQPDPAALQDGASLLPLLRTPSTTLPERDLFWTGRICKARSCVDSGALRNGSWKLLIEDGGKPALYNLAADIGERRNIAASQPALYQAMVARYHGWKAMLPDNASGRGGRRRNTSNPEGDE